MNLRWKRAAFWALAAGLGGCEMGQGAVSPSFAPVGPCTTPSPSAPRWTTPSAVIPKPECGDQNTGPLSRLTWQTFIAINWPADVDVERRGMPREPHHPEVYTDIRGPRVWQTWKQSWETMPQSGDASSWDSYKTPSPPCTLVRDEGDKTDTVVTTENWPRLYKKYNSTVLDQIDTIKHNPKSQKWPFQSAGPLIDRNNEYVRAEIRYNSEIHDCVTRVTSRLDCTRIDNTISFPAATEDVAGAIAVKASWRKVTGDVLTDKLPYYQTTLLVLDYEYSADRQSVVPICQAQKSALVGMHIAYKNKHISGTINPPDAGIRLPPNEWFWATFEHGSNAEDCSSALNNQWASKGYDWEPPRIGPLPLPPATARMPVQVCRISSIPEDAISLNKEFQGHLWEGYAPWGSYQMVANQWVYSGQPSPRHKVANTTLEPFAQQDSCVGCHAGVDGQAYAPNAGDFLWSIALAKKKKRRTGNPYLQYD